MAYLKEQSRDRFLQAIKLGTLTDFEVLGWGVADLGIEYETDEQTDKWVTQRVGSTRNKGYTLSSAVDEVIFADNPIFKEIDKIRRGLLVGEKASGTLLNINLYDSELEQPASVSGEEFGIEIAINSFAGPSEDPLSISYTINYQGAPVLGTVAITYGEEKPTFVFTKDVAGE